VLLRFPDQSARLEGTSDDLESGARPVGGQSGRASVARLREPLGTECELTYALGLIGANAAGKQIELEHIPSGVQVSARPSHRPLEEQSRPASLSKESIKERCQVAGEQLRVEASKSCRAQSSPTATLVAREEESLETTSGDSSVANKSQLPEALLAKRAKIEAFDARKRHSLPEEPKSDRESPSIADDADGDVEFSDGGERRMSAVCSENTFRASPEHYFGAHETLGLIEAQQNIETSQKLRIDPKISRPHSLHKSTSGLDDSKSGDQSSLSYKTAPLACASSASNADFTTVSTASLYETAKSSSLSCPRTEEFGLSSSTLSANQTNLSEMVSLSALEGRAGVGLLSQNAAPSEAGSATITPNTEELEDNIGLLGRQEFECGEQAETLPKTRHQMGSSSSQELEEITANSLLMDEQDMALDDEQLRRILTCKRLSEGCNRLNSSFIGRKNSLHMIEEMPPLTEGETMKHMSYHMSQNIESAASSGGSSGSLRCSTSRAQSALRDIAMKRGSQDENTSCSSSTSLERSPTRRRSSTVSQCSSVLSEGTRNQLNFDLSPDLAPDSSLMEANAISPTELDRPATPEPSSISGDQFDSRPISRLSHEEPSLALPSPDSTLGDSNDNELMEDHLERLTQSYAHHMDTSMIVCESQTSEKKEAIQADPLERLISEVSTVVVSARSSSKRPATEDSATGQLPNFGQKSAKSAGEEVKISHLPPSNENNASLDQTNPNPLALGDGQAKQAETVGAPRSQLRSPQTRSARLSGRSRTLNSPSPTLQVDSVMAATATTTNSAGEQTRGRIRSAHSTCSSSASSSSSSSGLLRSPRPTTGNEDKRNNGKLEEATKLSN